MCAREPRKIKQVGEGGEATVWSADRPDRPSGIVLKDYKDPITEQTRARFEEEYRRLQAIYGHFIPRQRLVRKKEPANEFVVAQERIHPADPASIMDYEASTLEPKTHQQLEELIRIIREQYQKHKKADRLADAQNLLDLQKKHNVLVTEDGDLKYVDTGRTWNTSFECNPAAAARYFEGPMALMELVSGRSGAEIMNDSLYAWLRAHFRRTGYIYGNPEDPAAFEEFLRNRYDGKGEVL